MKASAVWLAIWLGTVAFALPVPQPGSDLGDKIAMSMSLRQSSVTLQEPVWGEFSLRNGLSEPIQFLIDNDTADRFELVVVSPTGKTTHQLLLTPGMGIGGTTLGPGAEFHLDLVLSRWYQFDSPGKYKIDVKMSPRVSLQSNSVITPEVTATLWLEVKPRDPDRLKRTCESLIQAALQGPDSEAKHIATLALAHVHDPIAIPYMARVAAETNADVQSPVVMGLGVMASTDGLETVLSALGPYLQQLEAKVREAQYRIQHHISVTD